MWQKRVVPEEPPRISPQKRASDADSDDGITKEPRTDIFTRQNEYVAGAVQHYFPSTSPSQSDEQSSVNYTENVEENEDMPTFGNESDDEQQSTPSPNTEIRDKFKEYCHSAYRNTCNLPPEIEAGVDLMALLAEKRAPLNLYDAIYTWHMEHIKATKFVNRKRLIELLSKRYNVTEKVPKVVKNFELPHSKSRIDLVINLFSEQLESLLTDPRINDDDYLFFNNNPFDPPPDDFTTLEDINTGLAYRETYKQLITDPTREVLLPIIFYMDGAVTGQYDHLPIESLKFTLGIFNAEHRDRAHAWRSLGYVTKFLREETQAKNIVRESQHMDASIYLSDDESTVSESTKQEQPAQETDDNAQEPADEVSDDEDDEDDNDDNTPVVKEPKIKSCNAQDLHAMIDKMLESYREVEQGIEWDLRYQGTTHQVTFIPFVLFIKGDSVEHDKHCGSYTSRTSVISQLCRYCCCPNEETDEPYRRDTRKTQQMVQDLVDKHDFAGLQGLSQQYIDNAWYKVGFGLHNDYGVHGASPLEILHWLQIGKYGKLRDMFFVQSGKSSQLSLKLNALAKAVGRVFKRQSDRDLPRTNFSKGLRKGKLMAHEMSGLLLVLIATIRCTEGRRLLLTESRGNQREFLGERGLVKNWVMLLETMLQWEAWLKLPRISVFDVERAEVKVRELMKLEKEIGKREEGMKFRTFNFHATIHVADDMLNFGVPRNVNTMSNESHHKPDKTAALRTQRRPKLFDIQCANQIFQMGVVNLGLQELQNGCRIWAYHENVPDKDIDNNQQKEVSQQQQPNAQQQTEIVTEEDLKNTGTRFRFFYNPDENEFTYTINSRMKDKHLCKLGPELSSFLESLVDLLGDDVEELALFTQHVRSGQTFRGSPRFLGKPWRDWVMIDWGEDDGGVLPGQIWCFVDLTNIPTNLAYEPGIYAVIESSSPAKDRSDNAFSEIFKPYLKELKKIHKDGRIERSFYLVDVESFHAPTVMIPDIGNQNPAAFLRMIPRVEWSAQFIEWLHAEHTREFSKK